LLKGTTPKAANSTPFQTVRTNVANKQAILSLH